MARCGCTEQAANCPLGRVLWKFYTYWLSASNLKENKSAETLLEKQNQALDEYLQHVKGE